MDTIEEITVGEVKEKFEEIKNTRWRDKDRMKQKWIGGVKVTMKMSIICSIGEPLEEESKSTADSWFEKIKDDNFTDLKKDNIPQIQEAQ